MGCDNRKRDSLSLRETLPVGAEGGGEIKSASLDTEVQESDNLGQSWAIPLLWQAQAMLSFPHKRQNGCGSRIMQMLDLWAQDLWCVSWKADSGTGAETAPLCEQEKDQISPLWSGHGPCVCARAAGK